MFRAISKAAGHPIHFWAKWVGFFAFMAAGWWMGDLMAYMVVWTTLLTQTTDSQTIVTLYTGNQDTCEIKAQMKELGRAVPGAREMIHDE
jgi:hypothetical protein